VNAMLPRPFLITALLLGAVLGVLVALTDAGVGIVYALLGAGAVAFTPVYARWDERHRS
jgi:hypothetical protein